MFKHSFAMIALATLISAGTLYAQQPPAETPAADTPQETAAHAKLHAVTNSGTSGKIAKFATDGSTTIDSVMTESAGQIGVGIAPAAPFHVNGIVRVDERVDSRKAGSDSINSGSGYYFGDSGGDYAALQLSLNKNIDFWTQPSSWTRTMTLTKAGFLGIGTTGDPASKLQVEGNIALANMYNSIGSGGQRYVGIPGANPGLFSGAGAYIGFTQGGTAGLSNDIRFYTHQSSVSYGERLRIDEAGNVGIGLSNPGTKLEAASMDAKGVLRLDGGDSANGGFSSVQVAFGFNNTSTFPHFIRTRHNASTPTSNAIDFFTSDGTQAGVFPANAVHGLTITAGRVGVGQQSPNYNLDVTGTGHFTGDVIIDGNIAAKYQDVAEWVPATTRMTAGTVVVLNREHRNEVMPSASPYDTAVAGVVSEQPGLVLGVAGDSKAQIATTGRVKVHVDATAGAIAIGDLLVTGNKPGMAMKSQPVDLGGVQFHRPGTVIGKALEPMPDGEGDILVLLSLQ